MIKITPETFTVFENRAETAFVRQLAAVLREAVPSLATEPDGPFFAQIRLLIEQARGFGLRSEQAIGCFAVTAGLLGVDFVDRFPAAREILEAGTDEERMVERLEQFTVALFQALEQ